MEKTRGRGNEGFTLVELLIVIVILGILATVTVFAVTGIADKGKTSACASDNHTIVSAEEAYSVEHSTYGTMTELVSAGRLHANSLLFTVAVNPAGDAYTLTGLGECAGYVVPGSAASPGSGGTTTGSATGVADTITFAGMSALSYSAPGATSTVVIIDNGLNGGSHDSLLDFQGFVSAGVPKAGVNVVLVDVATAIADNVVPNAAAAVDAVIATNPALIATYFGADSNQTSAALSNRHQFALGASYSPTWGIDSVLHYYDDFKLGQAGGVATMYAGMPAVRIGSATAAHKIVIFPHGTNGDNVKSDFATLGGLPADLSVTMIAITQANVGGLEFPDWIVDDVLAQHPDVVAAVADMTIFHNGSGSSHQDIGDYVFSSHPAPTTFEPLLQSGHNLAADISAISTAKGWG